MQEELLFICNVECAAVARLNKLNFGEKYLPYPILLIIFSPFDTSSNDKHPAW